MNWLRFSNPTRLPGVVRLVDTSRPADFGNAAVQYGDEAVAWHVTDDPEKAQRALSQGKLVKAYRGPTSELGAGLYASAIPDYWIGRARGKWDFLKRLDDDQLRRLIAALRVDLDRLAADHYLSSNEYKNGVRDLSLVEVGQYTPEGLGFMASQPYNVRFWEPAWLKRVGIESGQKPIVMELHVRGLLAELESNHPSVDVLRALRRVADGAFVRGGWSTSAQLVVWNAKAVTYFGPNRIWEPT